MADKKALENKIYLGIGIVTILSGIFLIIEGDYFIGFSGSCVGLLIMWQNWQAIKNSNSGDDH